MSWRLQGCMASMSTRTIPSLAVTIRKRLETQHSFFILFISHQLPSGQSRSRSSLYFTCFPNLACLCLITTRAWWIDLTMPSLGYKSLKVTLKEVLHRQGPAITKLVLTFHPKAHIDSSCEEKPHPRKSDVGSSHKSGRRSLAASLMRFRAY